MVGSIFCSPINFLGATGHQVGLLGFPGYTGYSGLPIANYGGYPLIYSGQTVSSSIYPFRTALDVLNTLPDYPTLGPLANYPTYSPFSSFPTLSNSPSLFTSVLKPADEVREDEVDAVDVSEEEVDEKIPASGIITVAEEVEDLPAPPLSLFRDPSHPPIPAGIAQATQPHFIQTLFKNPKVSPLLQLVSNSKDSPVLQQIKEQSAGIVSTL
jgi:hypothetical protein